MKAVYQMLREYREQRGITQTHVAKNADISPKRLSQLETGLIRLTADEMVKIVTEGFGITPANFFTLALSESENIRADNPTD